MRRRGQIVRVLGVAEEQALRGRLVSDITPGDHCRLHLLLLAKPAAVLRRFAALQIVCLAQMEGWAVLKAERPEEAERVIAAAAHMGIPEGGTGETGRESGASDEKDHYGCAVAGGTGTGEVLGGDRRKIRPRAADGE